MYDVITIGSATRDIYIKSAGLRVIDDTDSATGKSIAFDLGSKIEVDEIHFETGGTALNTAVTFGNQGLKCGIISKIGDDIRGRAIIERTEEMGVDMLVPPDADEQTAYSLILNAAKDGRSILVYRGILDHIGKADIPWDTVKGVGWIYITHLAGASAKQFDALVEFAGENNISIAMNPGQTQLERGSKLRPLLQYTDILFVNSEEAARLTSLSPDNAEEMLSVLADWVKGLVVITKGGEGVLVSDGTSRWDAGILKEPVYKDRTGAGDAFGSGFTTARIQGKSVEEAIQLGSANATGVLGEWGSNKGLLASGEDAGKYGTLKITKTS